MHILFVCTGNTCRSSMAEGILRASAAEDEALAGEISVVSAGVAAAEGYPASESSVKVLRDEWGINIGSHRSRFITREMVDRADLVLTMTRDHKAALLRMFPEARNKTYTLKEYVADAVPDPRAAEYDYSLDIMDPYGMNERIYRRCAGEIKAAIDKLVVRLKNERPE